MHNASWISVSLGQWVTNRDSFACSVYNVYNSYFVKQFRRNAQLPSRCVGSTSMSPSPLVLVLVLVKRICLVLVSVTK